MIYREKHRDIRYKMAVMVGTAPACGLIAFLFIAFFVR